MKNALFLGLLMLGVSVSTAQVKASEKTGKVESVSYDTDGHVIAKGTYVEGKREGTWFFLTNEGIRIANYSNNQLVSHAISKDGYALLND